MRDSPETPSRIRCRRSTHPVPIRLLVSLRAGRPDCRAAATVEHFELDPGRVDRLAHQAAQCVYLAHQVALRRSADGGVARHVGHRLSRERAQSDTQPQARYRPRGLATGMSSANDDDIKERLQAQSLVIRGTSPMAEIVGVESWAQSQTPHRPAFVAPRLRPCSGRGEPVEPRLRRGRQFRPFIVSSDPSSSVPTLHRQFRPFIVSSDPSSSAPTRGRTRGSTGVGGNRRPC